MKKVAELHTRQYMIYQFYLVIFDWYDSFQNSFVIYERTRSSYSIQTSQINLLEKQILKMGISVTPVNHH